MLIEGTQYRGKFSRTRTRTDRRAGHMERNVIGLPPSPLCKFTHARGYPATRRSAHVHVLTTTRPRDSMHPLFPRTNSGEKYLHPCGNARGFNRATSNTKLYRAKCLRGPVPLREKISPTIAFVADRIGSTRNRVLFLRVLADWQIAFDFPRKTLRLEGEVAQYKAHLLNKFMNQSRT